MTSRCKYQSRKNATLQSQSAYRGIERKHFTILHTNLVSMAGYNLVSVIMPTLDPFHVFPRKRSDEAVFIIQSKRVGWPRTEG